jgi:hypothetical protein
LVIWGFGVGVLGCLLSSFEDVGDALICPYSNTKTNRPILPTLHINNHHRFK